MAWTRDTTSKQMISQIAEKFWIWSSLSGLSYEEKEKGISSMEFRQSLQQRSKDTFSLSFISLSNDYIVVTDSCNCSLNPLSGVFALKYSKESQSRFQ